MPQYVQVGNDVIEFPDNMDDAAISKALSENFPEGKAASNGLLRGIKDPIDAGAQALPWALQQATSLGGLAPNRVSDFFGREHQKVDAMVKADEKAYQEQRGPDAGFDGARLVGNIAVPLGAAGKLLQGPNKLKKALAGGIIGGATTPVTEEGDGFGIEKLKQVAIGGAVGPVGEKVLAGAGRVISPHISKAEQAMRDMGVQLTPGESLGGMYRNFEEAAQNLPFVGTKIKNAREKTLYQFNEAVINKSLSKIGQKLEGEMAGRNAVEEAVKKVSAEYDFLLNNMNYTLDSNASRNILAALNNAKLSGPAQRQAAVDIINERVLSRFDGQSIDGPTMKMIESDLNTLAGDYMRATSASDNQVGRAIQEALKAFKATVRQQNPTLASGLRRVDSAYRDLDIIQRAAANTAAERGVFTPKQYQQAVRQADGSRNKRGFARGSSPQGKLADDSLEAMGNFQTNNNINNITKSMGLGGTGAALYHEPAMFTGALGAGYGLYTEPGLFLADKLINARPEVMKKGGKALYDASGSVGGLFGASTIAEYNREDRKKKKND